MAAARDGWADALDATRLFFLDETWFSTAMGRTRGYAPRGERLDAAVRHGHWKTTFVGGLTAGGFVAPMLFDGPMTSAAFVAYVGQVLAKEARPGDVVVMDNLSSHKTVAARAVLEAAGVRYAYLPPYSPNLNPIKSVTWR